MVPTAGLSVHVTALLEVAPTVAVKFWVCEAVSEIVEGATESVTGGLRLTLALADLLESAVLVAVTVTFCALAIEAGAV
jgi:hypothetical protein